MRGKYPLPILLKRLVLLKSSYYYQEESKRRGDKYFVLKSKITEIFNGNKACYGYRRLYVELKKAGHHVSEKIVRRLMREEHLKVKIKKYAQYNSYKGAITPAVPNVIKRNFYANEPHEKLLTDITEFAIPAGKVYLSPIVDCFDGYLPCWTIGVSPNADLVNSMLDKEISILPENKHPIIHSDRGCHYRWPGWINRMDARGLIRSMSRKGCSPDNSACEGVFGRIKNEMFYARDWQGVSIEEFIVLLDEYLHWY